MSMARDEDTVLALATPSVFPCRTELPSYLFLFYDSLLLILYHSLQMSAFLSAPLWLTLESNIHIYSILYWYIWFHVIILSHLVLLFHKNEIHRIIKETEYIKMLLLQYLKEMLMELYMWFFISAFSGMDLIIIIIY